MSEEKIEDLKEKSAKVKKKRSFLEELKAFFIEFCVCISLVLICTTCFFKPVVVSGESMYPTLTNKEVGIVNIIGKTLQGVDRFDIVIIHLEDKYIIKRVIGLPGDTVKYIDGQLYINGNAIDEPYLDTVYERNYPGEFMEDIPEFTLGADEYYCLGDNRPDSLDSRYYGPFSLEQISGKDLFVIHKNK